MSERTPEQVLNDGRRIDAFLKDDAIVAAFSRMERRYYEEFIAAPSSGGRVTAQAKARVLKDFEGELKIILDRGEMEALHAAKRVTAAAHTQDR